MKIIVFLVFFISTNLMSQNSSIEFDYGVSTNTNCQFIYSIIGYGSHGEQSELASSDYSINNSFKKKIKKDLDFKLEYIKVYYKPWLGRDRIKSVMWDITVLSPCEKRFYTGDLSGKWGVKFYIQYNIKQI